MRVRFAVIDDAAFLRELIKNIVIAEGGVCVGEADNGEDAVRIVLDTLPDVVFLDMVMPLRNGIETARAIKELHPEIQIIGCSTVDSADLIEKAREAGFDSYITKPFTKDQILKEIERVQNPSRGDSVHG